MIRAILLAAILATPAVAQTDPEIIDKLADQYGDFAPAVEEKPLDELLPDMEAETTGTDDPAPQSGKAAAETAQPEVAQDTPADPGPAEILTGWTRHEVFGLTFAVPDDWEVMRESNDTYALAAPGFTPEEKKGLGLAIQLVNPDDFVGMFLEDPTFSGLLEVDKRPPLPVAAGIGFDRFTGMPERTGAAYAMDGAISRYRHPQNGHLTVNFIAFDPALLSEKADIINRIYATMRLADPEGFKARTTLIGQDGAASAEATRGEAVTTLGDLVAIRPPEGWDLKPGEEEVTLRTKTVFSAAITLRRGAAARDALSFDGVFQGEPAESTGRILGQPARIFSGSAAYVGMQFVAMERGEVRVYVLEQCLPDGSPVMIETAAAPGWLEKNDLQPVLAGIEADWPEGMQTCHPAISARAEWAMDGLFAFVLPEGFERARSRSSFWIRTKTGPYAALRVGTGPDSFPSDFQLAASNSLGNGFIAPPRTRRVEIMGEPATLFVGRSRTEEGSRVLYVALLDRCLPDDGPVMIKLHADDEWLAENDGFDKLLMRSWLVLPEDAKPCDASLIETALEVSSANQASAVSQEDESTSPPAPPASEHPSDSQSAGTATETAGDGAWRPVGNPVTGGLDSKAAVENGPTKPTAFRLEDRAQIDRVTTYHWNGGRGAAPGTIALRDADGRLHGPWPARGSEGQDGVANAYWHAEPGIVLPAGRYTIVDSDPGTWATNDEVGRRGIFTIEVRPVVKRGTEEIGGEPAPSALPSDYYTPARGTEERAALMDAARVPVERALGQKVLFVVSTLRSDGNWAYMKATPVQPNGEPLDWSRTPMAEDWRADAMSDRILIVLHRGDGGWRAAEHVIGPTDVAWITWVNKHGWPRALFID